ncbi:MAG: hypothetical protein HW388_57 [Dehalococcoidia bacterium]|nr:hypothetical protein [Dehalococcoidia bacterium]
MGFFVLIVAVVAAGLWGVVQRLPQASAIPEEIGGFRLLSTVEGPQALQMVAGLHQEGSPQLTEARVAYYEQGGVVWAGTATSPDAAREQLEAMAQAIGEGGTPFSNLRELSLAGRRVFTVSDGNNAHYFFFQSDAQVIWITPPGDSGTFFVEAALREF